MISNPNDHWIGLRESLRETMAFLMKYGGFRFNFPFNQSIEMNHTVWSDLFLSLQVLEIAAGDLPAAFAVRSVLEYWFHPGAKPKGDW